MTGNNIVNNKPELLDRVVIKNEHNKTLTITEFLDKLGTWKIKNGDLCTFFFVVS